MVCLLPCHLRRPLGFPDWPGFHGIVGYCQFIASVLANAPVTLLLCAGQGLVKSVHALLRCLDHRTVERVVAKPLGLLLVPV